MARTVSPPRARKAAFAAFVGTTIEWYDFYIYSFSAGLVFGTLFFPEGTDRLIGIAAAFGATAVGFFARPLGGVIFGHIGDRIGRRPALVITLMLMGAATFAVGLLPVYAQIGAAAPILLVLLRFVQGLAVGGEWGGAVLMAVEHAPASRKTLFGSFAQLGNPAGALLATSLLSLFSGFGDDFFREWGWRIPFLLSAVLVVVGLIVRLTVEESPVFAEEIETAEEERKTKSLPLAFALRHNWGSILLGIGVLPVATGGYYIVTTFATAYATGPSIGLDESVVLNALSVASIVELVATVAFGWLGDRIGRRLVVTAGLVGVAVLAFPQFLVLDGGTILVIFLLFAVMRLVMSATYGPVATVLSQMFRPQARYTSISLSYQVAGALFGGLSPVVATLALQATGSIVPVVLILIGMCAVSTICLLFAPQYTDAEADHAADEPSRAPTA
jgi:MFS family permease